MPTTNNEDRWTCMLHPTVYRNDQEHAAANGECPQCGWPLILYRPATHNFGDFERMNAPAGDALPQQRRVLQNIQKWEVPSGRSSVVPQPVPKDGKRRAVVAAFGIKLSTKIDGLRPPSPWFKGDGSFNSAAMARDLEGLYSDKTIKKHIPHLEEAMAEIEDAVTAMRRDFDKRIQELKDASERLNTDPANAELLQAFGVAALTVARVAVNIIVLRGTSLSMLPSDIDLSDVEASTLKTLKHIGNQKDAGRPIHDLAVALGEFQNGTCTEFALGVHAARAALAALGESLGGALSQLQLAYFKRCVEGDYAFVGECEKIAFDVRRLVAADEDGLVAKYPALHLMPVSETLFACYLNAASALLGIIAREESEHIEIDFREASRFVELARQLPNCREDFELLEAELVGVAVFLKDNKTDAHAFWKRIGKARAEVLIGEMNGGKEDCGTLVHLVAQSAEAVFPELAKEPQKTE